MSVRKGDQAPGFSLPCQPGETIDIGERIGQTPIVLLFFPLAFSSVCTDEMCLMRDDWNLWSELNAEVYGITCDSPFVTSKFRGELEIPFPILSDFNRQVSRDYGSLHSDLMGLHDVPKRAVFVIDQSGEVIYDWVSDDPASSPIS